MVDLLLRADVPESRLANLTRDLARDLSRVGTSAKSVGKPAAAGEKGEVVTLGVIALALVTSGTVKAVVECLKAYLSRERSLHIKLTDSTGSSVEITSHNVDSAVVREALLTATSAKRL